MKTIFTISISLTLTITIFMAALESASSQEAAPEFSPYVDREGQISLPDDYKTKWVHLGDWAISKDEKSTPHEFHEVYTQPGVIEAFQKTGEFPDGAVLVKEVRGTASGRLTTGQGTWAGEIENWFVMIKDGNKRFPDNAIWGDGWGWAFFAAADPKTNTTTSYKSSCIGCHIPAEQDDWVYVQGYPTLKQQD